MSDKKSNLTVNRRKVLQSASAAGIALGGFNQTVSAQETPTGSSVTFTEVKLTHDVSVPDEPQYHYPSYTVDDFSRSHSVDPAQSNLYLNENRNRGVEIPAQKAVVASEGYSSAPAKLYGSSPSGITTSIHGSYRTDSAVLVKNNGYAQPEISVDVDNNELSISTEGKEITASPKTEQILKLPEREITVEAFEYADEEPPERDDHRPAAPLRNYHDVQLTVSPKIHARNHGKLDVVNLSSPSPVPPRPQSEQ